MKQSFQAQWVILSLNLGKRSENPPQFAQHSPKIDSSPSMVVGKFWLNGPVIGSIYYSLIQKVVFPGFLQVWATLASSLCGWGH